MASWLAQLLSYPNLLTPDRKSKESTMGEVKTPHVPNPIQSNQVSYTMIAGCLRVAHGSVKCSGSNLSVNQPGAEVVLKHARQVEVRL